ncbi:hypothetical protein IJD44_02365 [bacterium]|nr:hypothetical protein [bacterium]
MIKKEYNSDFLSFAGRISRKDYIINMLILVALFVLLTFTNFNSLLQYSSSQLVNIIVIFVIGIIKFTIVASIISIVYRRISDISNFSKKMKNFFIIFYFVPFVYLGFARELIDFLPIIIFLLDRIIIFILIPIATVSAIIFSFLKSKTN